MDGGMVMFKVKPTYLVPKHLAYLIPSEFEILKRMYWVDTNYQVELTESSMSKFFNWIKENYPDYLQRFGKIENCLKGGE